MAAISPCGIPIGSPANASGTGRDWPRAVAESSAKLPQDVIYAESVQIVIDTAPGSGQRVGTEAPATMENDTTRPDGYTCSTAAPAADPRSEYPFTPDTAPEPETDPRSQFPFTDVPEPEAGFVPAPVATVPAPADGEPIGAPVGSYPAAPAPRVTEVDMMDPPFSSDPPAEADAVQVQPPLKAVNAAPAPQLESGFDIQEPATATGPLDETEPVTQPPPTP